MDNERFYEQTIINDQNHDIFVKDILLYELNSLEEEKLNPENCRLFRTGRYKNDMPSVCTFGLFDDSMKDCISAVKESGDGKESFGGNIIISDHLTILGNDSDALFIAFMSGNEQLFRTEIQVDDSGKFISLKVFVEFRCFFKPGEARTTEKLMVKHTDNVTAEIKKWATLRAKPKRRNNPPAVFCTWYYYGKTVTYEDVSVNLQKIREKNLPFDVFQIDDGWETTLGEWTPNSKFPESMKAVCDEIKSAGLIPGIWTGPFVAHETASIWKSHPDWILKDNDNNPVLFPMNEGVYFIIDISIEETWKYFEKLYRKLTFEWGYTYHKIDFTRAPVIAENACFSNKYLTAAQCYRKAVEAIRKGMGEDSFMLMCGGLYDPVIGIVDAQRAGSDVLSMWSSNINRNGKTLPYTIKQSLLRYYMNNWWFNDPDALMIRKNETMERNLRLTYGLLNDEEVKTSVLNQLTGGGLMCSTEPLDKIDDERLSNLKHILPIRPLETQTVDIMNIGRFPDKIRLKEISNEDAAYLVIINWSDDESIYPTVSVKEIAGDFFNLDDSVEYSVKDFYGKKVYTKLDINSKITLSEIKPHASTILK
ncbi:MAG: alpha-galactosidase, partial [Ruminococcus sp.]|nr:alpha-galactosidase [Candidatus Copronaster equi]